MARRRYTIAGAEFSAPDPIGAVVYARLKENSADDLREMGATDKDIEHDIHWIKWLTKLLREKPMLGSLRILESLLRPESGVSVLDAYESDTKGEAGEPMNFFTKSLTVFLADKTKSAKSLTASQKARAKRKP